MSKPQCTCLVRSSEKCFSPCSGESWWLWRWLTSFSCSNLSVSHWDICMCCSHALLFRFFRRLNISILVSLVTVLKRKYCLMAVHSGCYKKLELQQWNKLMLCACTMYVSVSAWMKRTEEQKTTKLDSVCLVHQCVSLCSNVCDFSMQAQY